MVCRCSSSRSNPTEADHLFESQCHVKVFPRFRPPERVHNGFTKTWDNAIKMTTARIGPTFPLRFRPPVLLLLLLLRDYCSSLLRQPPSPALASPAAEGGRRTTDRSLRPCGRPTVWVTRESAAASRDTTLGREKRGENTKGFFLCALTCEGGPPGKKQCHTLVLP